MFRLKVIAVRRPRSKLHDRSCTIEAAAGIRKVCGL